MSSAITPSLQEVYSPSTTPDVNRILSLADFWVDFSDPACYTLSTVNRVATVTDKSATPKTITITGAVYFDTVAKGIRLSGGAAASDFLTVSGLSPPGTVAATAQETIFIVAFQFSPSASAYIGGTSSGSRYIRGDNGTVSYGRLGATPITQSFSVGLNKLYVISAELNNGVASQYLNGGFCGSGASTMTASPTTQQIGRAIAPGPVTYPHRGGIYEIIIFQTELSDTQRRMIENYLINKWSIQTTSLTSPLSISGCTLWLDGNDASTIVYGSGTNVQQWSDKSGNGYHAIQNTAGNQPTYDSTLKGVLFNSTNLTALFTTAPFSRTETIFAVVNMNPTTPGNILGNTSSTRGREFLTVGAVAATGALRVYADSTITLTGLSAANNFTTTDRCVVSFANASATNRCETTINGLNDQALATAINYTAGTFTNVVGASTAAGNIRNYNSYIYEIILFNSELTDQQRIDIINYLMNKWGIQRFPTSNVRFPFYRSPFLRLFNPLDIANCLVWLDGNDTTTISFVSGTSNITQWNDKSRNNNHAVAGTATYPTYASNTLNGLGTVRLRGNNDYFLISTNNFTTTAFPSLCYFAVVNIAASQPVSRGAILSTDTAGQFGRSLAIFSGSYEHEYYSGFTTLTAYTANTWQITALQFSGTAATTFSLNGTTFAGTASGTGTNTTGLKIGSYNSDGAYASFNANFDVAEILVYGTVISGYERQLIEGYLANKWGLRNNLPSTHIYRPLLPTNVIFTPLNINAFCVLWLDAADATTITTTSGNVITQWRDKSGSGFLGAFSAGRNFTYATNIRKGLNVVQTATGQTMTISNFVLAASMSIFVLYMPINQSIGSPFIEQGPDANGVDGFFFHSQNNNNFLIRNGGGTAVANFGTTAVSNTWEMIEGINKDPNASNTMSYYTNGTLRASGGNTTNNVTVTNTLFINGRNNTNTLSYPTYIAEILIYNMALTTAQRQQIEGYLAWKWGTQASLPSTHPHSRIPPF